MALTAGTRIGPYEVRSPLGQGGMGVVFRAHDTQLQRDVALKLLPNDFASDPDRLSRFQREAQVLASLNHPNIAQIYGLEGAGESRCIVMELVDGETLAERLKRGALPKHGERSQAGSPPAGSEQHRPGPAKRQVWQKKPTQEPQSRRPSLLRVQKL